MSRILVTGASGFIGRHLCSRLLHEGHELTALSRSGTNFPNATNITLDLTRGGDLSLNLKNVDVIIHLAARVHKIKEPIHDRQNDYTIVNKDVTSQLATLSAINGVRRFIYISSIGVNGNHTLIDKPFTEEDLPNPHDLYSISKYEAEKALVILREKTAMEIVILRPPSVYGPGGMENFTRLVRLIHTRIPLPFRYVHNNRSFIYVENLVDAIILCAITKKTLNDTYLVSDDKDLSTPQLINQIAITLNISVHLFSFPLGIIRLALRVFSKEHVFDRFTSSLRIDTSKIRNELGWTPPYSVEEGLKRTFYKNSVL